MIPGLGILKGLSVTLWNFILSYVQPKKGIFTIQYPEEQRKMPARYRNFPFLIYDESPQKPRCVACEICAKECPPKCMRIIMKKDAQGKPLRTPEVFDIDTAICMNCGICEDVCPFDSIYMNHEYKLASFDREKTLMVPKEKLLKPISYFAEIRPEDCAAVEAKRAAKQAKQVKKGPA